MGIFEGMERKASVGIAKDRLRTLIVSDRIDCNPNVGELFQKDLFATISKYIDTTLALKNKENPKRAPFCQKQNNV